MSSKKRSKSSTYKMVAVEYTRESKYVHYSPEDPNEDTTGMTAEDIFKKDPNTWQVRIKIVDVNDTIKVFNNKKAFKMCVKEKLPQYLEYLNSGKMDVDVEKAFVFNGIQFAGSKYWQHVNSEKRNQPFI